MNKQDFEYDVDKYEQFFFSRLSEFDKRQYAGLEAMKCGYNGVYAVSQRLGIDKRTVRKGKSELIEYSLPCNGKVRKSGGGRKKRQQGLSGQ
jgi:hypothetical protein